MPGDESTPRRDRILSAATAEFAERGFAGARIERIAALANVNKQLLFHYFGSKEGLFRAALRSLLEGPVTAAQPAASPSERLRDVTTQLIATTEAHPSLLALLASRSDDPEATAIARDWRERARRQARQILQDAQRAGYVRDDADVDAISEVIVGSSLGMATAGDRGTAGRGSTYQETLLRMAIEYCSWR